jgi:prepilin-type N-terminal cleavage/methylation domain-containing protein
MINNTGCGRLDSRGFTLLELLIAIAMTAIIVVIVAGAMKLSIRSVDRGEKRIDALERIRTSINIVEAQIQSMTGLTYDDNGEKKHYFKAARDSLKFSTDYSIWGGQRGYTVVSYTVVTGNNGKQTMKATENVAGIDNGKDTPLLGSFDKVYFEYYSKGPTDEKGSWVDEWTDDINIPEKVKLHLVSGQNNFALIIPVRAAAFLNEKAAAPNTPGTPLTPLTPLKPGFKK